MTVVGVQQHEKLLHLLKELQSADLRQDQIRTKSLDLIDVLSRKKEGLEWLYENIPLIEKSGIFNGTSWVNPNTLVPTLVKGTLCSGYPMIVYETLSELRMLKVANGEWSRGDIDQKAASQFLQEAVVSSFDLAFHGSSETARQNLTTNERKRLRVLFEFILERISFKSLLERLAYEVRVISAQRPILTNRLEDLIHLVKGNIELDVSREAEANLKFFVDALFHPSSRSKDIETYKSYLETCEVHELEEEARIMGTSMNASGIVSIPHVVLLKVLALRAPEYLSLALALDNHGEADLQRHLSFVVKIIDSYIDFNNRRVAYGLGKLLNRNLLSRKAVSNALNKLFNVRLHSDINRLLSKAFNGHEASSTLGILCGGVINLLGQPLGVGQGLNPTCQSARGLSMWSRHSPEKLLNLIINVAVANKIQYRYEGELIESEAVFNEANFDFNLDPVSVILVPHLDSVYQQMMQKAQFKHPLEDPHVSVNPAFYGHWIQTGFISCYNTFANRIENYEHFVKCFYAAFHPLYNGGYKLIYPIPLGIFITTAQAELLGFHAVSLLRIAQNKDGEWRAYFFNPNNEGRQNWGQEIIPTVASNQEAHGESSLPVHEFVSRVYAFHYNSVEVDFLLEETKVERYPQILKLARDSWGKQYVWDKN